MNNFIYSIPTIAYFGKVQIAILGETIKAQGGSKVLLAYGGGSIKKNGIYDAVVGAVRQGRSCVCGVERHHA